jgi:hypothetical protein
VFYLWPSLERVFRSPNAPPLLGVTISYNIMLDVAHEVVITNLKSQQPHSCTCAQIETILPSTNACCSSSSKSFFDLEFLGIDDIVYQELKEEDERLRMSMTQLKGKSIAQPSQGNRDDTVKKLETGTTVACTKSLEESVKDLRNVERKEQKKKINTCTKSLKSTCIQGKYKVMIKPHFTLRKVRSVVNALKRDT